MSTVNQNNYRYLEFAEFKDLIFWDYYSLVHKDAFISRYRTVKLGEVLKLRRESITIENDAIYKRCKVQLYGRGIILRDEVPGAQIKTKKQQLCKTDDFLVAEIDAKFGGYGIVPPVLHDAIVSSHYFLFEIDNTKLRPSFLSLVVKLRQFSNQVKATGSTNYAAIRPFHVLDYKIPLPALEEQDGLVEAYNTQLLSAAEKEIEADQTDVYSTKFFNFELGISEKPKSKQQLLRYVEFKDLQRWGAGFSNTRRWIIEPRFEQELIKNICKIGSGGTPPTAIASYYGGDIPWVTTSEVVNEIITTTAITITREGLEHSSAKIYSSGSLIIAMYGQGATRGRTAKLGIDAATNQACAVLYDIDNSKLHTDFLWLYLINEYERLRELASGNNQPNLNAGMIANYLIQIPPLEKQIEIIEKLYLFRHMIKTLKATAAELRANAIDEFERNIFQS